ncbi:MAG: hypothetical protein JNM95_02530 [Chitinophagaceae bacterium]|nr:hypothetical protein [Chitinophagaceae bacterium]
MKKYLLSIMIIFVVTGCNRNKKMLEATAVVWLFDITEGTTVYPSWQSILDLYHFPENRYKEAYFKKGCISNFKNNEEDILHLDNQQVGEQWNRYDDPKYRDKQVIAYMNQVKNSIEETTNSGQDNGRKETQCYHRIVSELEYLSSLKAKRKVMIITSDVIENSELLRGYSSDLYHLMINDRNKAVQEIAEKFSDDESIPNKLSGIDVYILFNPRTKEDDIRFDVFSSAYKQMIEENHGRVFIKSSQNIKEQ